MKHSIRSNLNNADTKVPEKNENTNEENDENDPYEGVDEIDGVSEIYFDDSNNSYVDGKTVDVTVS